MAGTREKRKEEETKRLMKTYDATKATTDRSYADIANPETHKSITKYQEDTTQIQENGSDDLTNMEWNESEERRNTDQGISIQKGRKLHQKKQNQNEKNNTENDSESLTVNHDRKDDETDDEEIFLTTSIKAQKSDKEERSIITVQNGNMNKSVN